MENLSNYVIYGKNRQHPEAFGIITSERKLHADHCNKIPPMMSKYLIEIEDRRFRSHHGIDYKSIARSIITNFKHRAFVQGASTITQQLARNITEKNEKTILRKVTETLNAIKLESKYDKDEILNLYFNKVYWGRNIYGVRAASLTYYKKEPFQLTSREQIQLLTLLRGPNLYLQQRDHLSSRYNLIIDLLAKRHLITFRRSEKLKQNAPNIESNYLSQINPRVIEFLPGKINRATATIQSSIDVPLQRVLQSIVATAKYPTSCVAYFKGEIAGFASSYGSDYPFVFKSNVGSCLKPFIYCFLRESGVPRDMLISSSTNLAWPVREVSEAQPKCMTIDEALLASNNSVFVNAAELIGFDKTLNFIKILLDRENDQLYPAAILGAVTGGLTINDLTKLYNDFFSSHTHSDIKAECLDVLKTNLYNKTSFPIQDGFLKTGTTNNNRERFAIFGNRLFTVGLLRQHYYENDYTKEGNFMSFIKETMHKILLSKKYLFF